jgi:hypothetical protein
VKYPFCCFLLPLSLFFFSRRCRRHGHELRAWSSLVPLPSFSSIDDVFTSRRSQSTPRVACAAAALAPCGQDRWTTTAGSLIAAPSPCRCWWPACLAPRCDRRPLRLMG